jgi:murein DD-endopeptidase MepM/ murein hydrolase activator NlpD
LREAHSAATLRGGHAGTGALSPLPRCNMIENAIPAGRRLIFFIIFLLILAGSLLPAQATLRLQGPSGAAVELTARSFQPGEAILAVLHGTPDVRAAELAFLGKRYGFAANGPAGLPFALLGIDLDTKPGSYRFTAAFKNGSGREELVEQYMRIEAKSFPRVNIILKDERLITPPPQAAQRIAREQQLLARIFHEPSAEWLAQGSFILPNPGRLKPNFGERRFYNGHPRSPHSGVDISAEMGEPVAASNAGRVALARDLYFAGNSVILDHGLGVFTFYCHFSKLEVREGQTVRRGDLIGLVGSTGRATGPHLHWSVRLGDARVDPLSLLSLSLE